MSDAPPRRLGADTLRNLVRTLALVAAIALTWAVTASRVFVAARRRPIEELGHE